MKKQPTKPELLDTLNWVLSEVETLNTRLVITYQKAAGVAPGMSTSYTLGYLSAGIEYATCRIAAILDEAKRQIQPDEIPD